MAIVYGLVIATMGTRRLALGTRLVFMFTMRLYVHTYKEIIGKKLRMFFFSITL